MSEPKQITIKLNDEFNITITGDDYITIDAGIKKLPYEIAAPLLVKLEQQIVEQQSKQI